MRKIRTHSCRKGKLSTVRMDCEDGLFNYSSPNVETNTLFSNNTNIVYSEYENIDKKEESE